MPWLIVVTVLSSCLGVQCKMVTPNYYLITANHIAVWPRPLLFHMHAKVFISHYIQNNNIMNIFI